MKSLAGPGKYLLVFFIICSSGPNIEDEINHYSGRFLDEKKTTKKRGVSVCGFRYTKTVLTIQCRMLEDKVRQQPTAPITIYIIILYVHHL